MVEVRPESAVDVVDDLLRRATTAGASDLHLDPEASGVVVSMRCDGVLTVVDRLPASLGPRVVGRFKALADLLAYRSDLPQEGRIAAERTPLRVEARVATYPTVAGERVAVRLEASGGSVAVLESLGLPEVALRGLSAALDQPEGVVLLTGPSGSGKTSTLYAALARIASRSPRRAVVTVEDPVERRVTGVAQTEVHPAAGLTFARALRSLLRQDPDVILVGEIRDRETASVALEAGLTGHLVASTVHAGTAPLVFARLLDLGVEPFVLTSAVRGVLAQRLLRRSDGEGGYAGRVLVAEWLPVGEEVRRVVLARGDASALAAAAKETGVATLREAAADLVARGLTTEEEVDRVLGVA
jgi:general secretion pathway protein E